MNDIDEKQVWKPAIRFWNMLGINKAPAYGGQVSKSFWLYEPNQLMYYEEMQVGLSQYFVSLISVTVSFFQVTVSCDFEFSTFPYDSHICQFAFGDLLMTSTYFVFNQPQLYHFGLENGGKDPVSMDRKRLPFEVIVTPMKPFEVYLTSVGGSYSYAGLQVKLIRNNRGKLYAGYYLLTGVFAMLSTLSFTIRPDQVR